ncbi:MAG: integrase [Chlamydiae bacterium CG10_big_fil_rev_8_21_14_0_10_35_9]|nr:MAG: integrase [Chlamydiae bacterium CG10_big_fil_rev_8_21_14_0_10_35_9]
MIRSRKDKNGNPRYQAIIKIKGYPNKAQTFRTKKEAQQWEIKIKAAIQEGRYWDHSNAGNCPFIEVVDRYIQEFLSKNSSNYKTFVGQLMWWKKQLGGYAIGKITSYLISQKLHELSKRINGRGNVSSPATLNRYRSSLSCVFHAACNDWGMIAESPLSKVRKRKEPRGRVRFLDQNEKERLLDACYKSGSHRLYLIVVLALATGMRKGEILNLKWEDVDLLKGKAILHETKNGERRIVLITGHALSLLRDHAKREHIFCSPYIFPSTFGTRVINIRSSWEYAVKLAMLSDFHFHDLRHTFASYLAMNGATLAEIAEALGHKTLAMVKRYAHLTEEHTRSVIEKMNEKMFG